MTVPPEHLDPARWLGEQVWMPSASYDVPLRREPGKTLKPMVSEGT